MSFAAYCLGSASPLISGGQIPAAKPGVRKPTHTGYPFLLLFLLFAAAGFAVGTPFRAAPGGPIGDARTVLISDVSDAPVRSHGRFGVQMELEDGGEQGRNREGREEDPPSALLETEAGVSLHPVDRSFIAYACLGFTMCMLVLLLFVTLMCVLGIKHR